DRKLAEAELERRAEQQAAVARLGKRALEGGSLAELMNESLQEATRITGADAAAVLERSADSGALTVRAGVCLWRRLMRERPAPPPVASPTAREGSGPARQVADRAAAMRAGRLRDRPPVGVGGGVDGK